MVYMDYPVLRGIPIEDLELNKDYMITVPTQGRREVGHIYKVYEFTYLMFNSGGRWDLEEFLKLYSPVSFRYIL